MHLDVTNRIHARELRKEQDETYRFLSSTAQIPPTKTHPYDTYFAMVNNGGHTIGTYSMQCNVNAAVSSVGVNVVHGIAGISQSYPGPVNGTGDSSESSQCLLPVHALTALGEDPPRCLDVSLGVTYALRDQPNIQQCKMFRYVAVSDGEKYLWLTEPINMKLGACYRYMIPRDEKEYEEQTSKLKEGGNCNQERER